MARPRKHTGAAERQRAYRARVRSRRTTGMESSPATSSISSRPSTARWSALISQARICLQTVQDEMQSYYDDRSDAWQEAERGLAFEERIVLVETAAQALEDLQSG
jgi:hypothetical protein